MVNKAIYNRLDLSISLEGPEKEQIEKLINLVLKEDQFGFDKKVSLTKLIESTKRLSYDRIQKILINISKQNTQIGYQKKKSHFISTLID